ncbi:glycosyltransferase family 4 protein [Congregibacter variabilis]|uniref:Glycosyltransferase family 4 protein n=1 Tax=Congregibacter variabilis TaxID=3081200 RepID=A0ABZ0I2Y2_9GAMM|nr:glycosyltransferase family 4 protein [Congregibacter sp. IMCC43200]
MTKPHRVLFVSHSPLLYGAERSLLSLVEALQQMTEYSPVVLLPARGAFQQRLETIGVEVIVHPYFWWITSEKKRLLSLTGCSLNRLLAKLFIARHSSLQIDLIYSNSLATPFGAYLAELLSIPHVWHFREFVYEDLNFVFTLGDQQSANFIKRTTHKVVCNSEEVRRRLANRWGIMGAEVIYNGFDFSVYKQLKPHEHHQSVQPGQPVELLILGRVHENKGQITAIRAVAELKRRGRHVRLTIVGKGSRAYLMELHALCKSSSLVKEVRFVGAAAEPLPYFQDASITLVCSHLEAFGRVAVEAMAMGCPVIAASSGGLQEIVTSNKTGLLYDTGDHISLANAVEKLIENPQLFDSVAAEAMYSARERFSLQKTVSATASMISFLIHERSRTQERPL